MPKSTTRRNFLKAGTASVAASTLALNGDSLPGKPPEQRRPRVAAIYTVCYNRSHAHVILENFLLPYLFNGQMTDPGVDVVSIYSDQTREQGDLTQGISQRFNIPVYRSIREALCRGGRELAVDAVLSIGEHGNYPFNELGQEMYPRKRFFYEIVDVMRASNRFVPVFNDKHLSYRWDWARSMYDLSLKFNIPFMAGSSVPLAQRRPPLEIANGTQLEEAVSIHGGPVERYDFHGLEILQSIVEFRQGGETGITSVEFWRGEEVWNAARNRRWSLGLADAAMRAEFGRQVNFMNGIEGEGRAEPHALHITYQDGFKATVLKIGQSSIRWNLAYKVRNQDQIQATSWYVGPWRNRNLFKALSHAIQHHFRNQQAPYPVERTLLTTGILEAAMRSRHQNGERIVTRHLHIGYQPRDFRAMREMGASWRIITDQTPEPPGIAQPRIPEN